MCGDFTKIVQIAKVFGRFLVDSAPKVCILIRNHGYQILFLHHYIDVRGRFVVDFTRTVFLILFSIPSHVKSDDDANDGELSTIGLSSPLHCMQSVFFPSASIIATAHM